MRRGVIKQMSLKWVQGSNPNMHLMIFPDIPIRLRKEQQSNTENSQLDAQLQGTKLLFFNNLNI